MKIYARHQVAKKSSRLSHTKMKIKVCKKIMISIGILNGVLVSKNTLRLSFEVGRQNNKKN
jgi:hypothetical protein